MLSIHKESRLAELMSSRPAAGKPYERLERRGLSTAALHRNGANFPPSLLCMSIHMWAGAEYGNPIDAMPPPTRKRKAIARSLRWYYTFV